jgi:transposase
MDWARRIVVNEGELVTEIESEDGIASYFPLMDLGKLGLPDVRPAVRKKFEVKFEDFSLCDAQQYRSIFGAKEAAEEGAHQVFEVVRDGKRYLVPALALMRALFRPTFKLLPQMFVPSALERVCRLEKVDDELKVVVDAQWATTPDPGRTREWAGPLSWMMLHPSARRMADSVHQHAMSGRIAIDLPDGDVELVFYGVQNGLDIAVTSIRVLSVFPWDKPDLPFVNERHQVDFINRKWAEGRNLREVLSTFIPLRADGSYELTDSEWAAIRPLLDGQRKRQRHYLHCQRALFNSVLGKLHTGTSWKKFKYTVGDWQTAATAYRSWRIRGTYEAAISTLRDMRTLGFCR